MGEQENITLQEYELDSVWVFTPSIMKWNYMISWSSMMTIIADIYVSLPDILVIWNFQNLYISQGNSYITKINQSAGISHI